jgi:organic hydroperoxide reductase OsmC/OhrA
MEHEKEHHYTATIVWTGNKGEGTSHYRAYDRDHTISVKGKPDIPGSSDVSFRGSPERYNPEDLLVISLSSCHMLWYLHLCAVNKVVVLEYRDEARGDMLETGDGGGRFKEVTLYPVVTVAEAGMQQKAGELHHDAHRLCYIANSVNFPVKHVPEVRVAADI